MRPQEWGRGTPECVRHNYARCLEALRGLTLAALDCLYALDFRAALRALLVAFLLAFAAAFPRSMVCFGLASMLVVEPKASASANSSARHLIASMLLRHVGEPQIHL